MTLGKKIKSRREELGLSQVELAAKSKLTQGYISGVENGNFIPKATTLIALAVALDYNPNEFLQEERRAG